MFKQSFFWTWKLEPMAVLLNCSIFQLCKIHLNLLIVNSMFIAGTIEEKYKCKKSSSGIPSTICLYGSSCQRLFRILFAPMKKNKLNNTCIYGAVISRNHTGFVNRQKLEYKILYLLILSAHSTKGTSISQKNLHVKGFVTCLDQRK